MSSNKTEMQNQLQKLLAEVNTLKQQIESMPDEKVVWEPKGGNWYVTNSGEVEQEYTTDDCRLFGIEYQTKELAEQALVAMRIHNRLLAYRAEFCPDYEPDWNDSNAVKYCVYFNTCSEKYGFSSNATYQMLGSVYFPREVAETLVNKLNSGEVVL